MINLLRKLEESLKLALEEEIFDGHIDKEELSEEVFQFLAQIAQEDEDGLLVQGKDFIACVEQLKEQTPEDEENELLAKLIEEIGPNNYEMLLNEELNYIVIHVADDAQMNDIKQEVDQVEDEEILEALNEIAMERYLQVGPNCLSVYCGDKEEAKQDFEYKPEMTDGEIRDVAKQHFQNITDDIRVNRK